MNMPSPELNLDVFRILSLCLQFNIANVTSKNFIWFVCNAISFAWIQIYDFISV